MTVKLSVVILGGSQVGKNSLVKAASEIYSCKSAKEKRTVLVVEMGGVKYEIKLWCHYDTGLTYDEQNELTQADGYIVMYDVTNKFSLERARMYHQKIVQMRGKQDKFPLVVVGNKSDRAAEGEREVSTVEGLQLGDEFGCPCFETCSTTMNNKGVDEVFREIVRLIEKSNKEKSFRNNGTWSPRISGGRRGGFLSFPESNREVDERQELENYRRQKREMAQQAEHQHS